MFIIGQTTNEEFEKMMSSSKAPMVELEIPGSIIFTVPVSTIKDVVTDMEAVANIWYDCMETIHWLIGYRFRKPARFVTDVSCAAGQAHSGYPVVAQPLQTKVYDIQYLKAGKVWGIFHELGHNIGMPHVYDNGVKNHPKNWDCGEEGSIMGGNARMEWSPCSATCGEAIKTRSARHTCPLPDNTKVASCDLFECCDPLPWSD